MCWKAETLLCQQGPYSQGFGLPSSHVWLSELDHKEGRTPKNWCLQTVELEKTPESPLDCKENKPVNLKGDQPWIVIGMTEAEAEAPVFWPSDVNRRLIGKVPDAGKDWGQKEKRASEGEMAGQHHWCSGHELGQTRVRDREAGCAAVHGASKSQTRLGDWRTIRVWREVIGIWRAEILGFFRKAYFMEYTWKSII